MHHGRCSRVRITKVDKRGATSHEYDPVLHCQRPPTVEMLSADMTCSPSLPPSIRSLGIGRSLSRSACQQHWVRPASALSAQHEGGSPKPHSRHWNGSPPGMAWKLRTVCCRGLCRPEVSFARIFVGAMPALQVYPSSSSTRARASATCSWKQVRTGVSGWSSWSDEGAENVLSAAPQQRLQLEPLQQVPILRGAAPTRLLHCRRPVRRRVSGV